jgi:Domain of unknown function (DUF4337)
MEAPEVPLEQVHEEIHHHAHESGERWISGVALSTALLAALAAIAALLAGDHANEAMLSQIKSSDQWAFYQSKSVKKLVLKSKLDILAAEGKQAGEKDVEKLAEYDKNQEEIQKDAKHEGEEAEEHLAKHKPMARSVTMFQIAIAISAISALTKRRLFWFVGLLFGAVGIFFLVQGFLAKAAEHAG